MFCQVLTIDACGQALRLAQSSETKVRVRRVVPIEDTPTSGWAKGVLTSDKIKPPHGRM